MTTRAVRLLRDRIGLSFNYIACFKQGSQNFFTTLCVM
jgi:hypothetical protein